MNFRPVASVLWALSVFFLFACCPPAQNRTFQVKQYQRGKKSETKLDRKNNHPAARYTQLRVSLVRVSTWSGQRNEPAGMRISRPSALAAFPARQAASTQSASVFNTLSSGRLSVSLFFSLPLIKTQPPPPPAQLLSVTLFGSVGSCLGEGCLRGSNLSAHRAGRVSWFTATY